MTKKTYHGACHCGAVTFETNIDFEQGTTRCNCSICTRSRFWFAIVPPEDFRMKQGADILSDYTWIPAGKTASHLHYRFCRICGVRTFAKGSDGTFYAVAIVTLDGFEQETDVLATTLQYNDGRNDDLKHAPADTRLL
jgi:hypothetical protein